MTVEELANKRYGGEFVFMFGHLEGRTRFVFECFDPYFGRAFPNWRARVIPTIVISGFLALVSKNPIRFSDGSMSNW